MRIKFAWEELDFENYSKEGGEYAEIYHKDGSELSKEEQKGVEEIINKLLYPDNSDRPSDISIDDILRILVNMGYKIEDVKVDLEVWLPLPPSEIEFL